MKDMKKMKNSNSICDFEFCDLKVYNNQEQCLLHINYKKNSFKTIKVPPTINFAGHLVRNIVNYLSKNDYIIYPIERKDVENALLEKQINPSIDTFMLKQSIKLEKIGFPERYDSEKDDYQYILAKLESVEFIDCDFACTSLKKIRIPCSFQNCRFVNKYEITNHDSINKNKPLFNNCTFNMASTVLTHLSKPIKSILFKDCIFNARLILENTEFNNPVFDLGCKKTKIFSLYVKNCIFQKNFILNNIQNQLVETGIVGTIDVSSSVFESKFELKNNNIGILNIYNTNFNSIVDFFQSSFNKLAFTKCIVRDFLGLEGCEFGEKGNLKTENQTHFTYTTFKSIPNFRKTKFFNGLDIENTNFKENPNFLHTKIEPQFTNRETFRIVKNSFDKVGNNIEADKFFALEMSKYKEELKSDKKRNRHKLFIFKWNDRLSNFGQSYLKPSGWLLLTMIAFSTLIYGKNNNWIYVFSEKGNERLSNIIELINNFAESFLPFRKFLVSGMELISLLFYVVFLILSWQIIVAVKRHTKR